MEFSRPEYWSGSPFPSPEVLPDSGIEPGSPALQADSLPAELLGNPDQEPEYHSPYKPGQVFDLLEMLESSGGV